MAKNAGDLLIERLIDWGVKRIFGFPGDGINGLYESLRTRKDQIQVIQVRHEEAAAFAACGYGKYTGDLGVCMATSGPGGIHLLNGLYDAKCDGIPVLAITGHTFHDLIGTHFQQDVDLTKVFMDVAEYNERVMGPSHVENVVDEAIRTAFARRGVAHINIPKDIQTWPAGEPRRSKMNIKGHSARTLGLPPQLPSEMELEAAAAVINRGTKVALLVGRGALHARDLVLRLSELTAAPIVKALLGKAVVPDDHPNCTGGIGLLGTAPSQDVMRGCDTLLIIGSSFPYVEFLPKPGQAKCVQIDADGTRIGLRYPVDIGLVGDSHSILEALLPRIQQKSSHRFLETAQKGMKEWRKLLHERATRQDKPLKPQVVAAALNPYLANDAILVSDCGTVTTWAARYLDIRDSMMFSCTGLLATMGNGLPYAVGASVAYPGRQVVAMVGDGGFTMMMGELATIKKYDLPIKIVIIKNNTLGQIKWEQMVFEGNPEYGVDLQPIDFAAYAQAVGIPGYTLDDPSKTDEVYRAAFGQQGPALVQAVVDPNEPPLPGHATLDQAWHFAKAMVRGEKYNLEIIKTVLEDKIREVV
jgi:pyruvate dehydrogenase (quinone)